MLYLLVGWLCTDLVLHACCIVCICCRLFQELSDNTIASSTSINIVCTLPYYVLNFFLYRFSTVVASEIVSRKLKRIFLEHWIFLDSLFGVVLP